MRRASARSCGLQKNMSWWVLRMHESACMILHAGERLQMPGLGVSRCRPAVQVSKPLRQLAGLVHLYPDDLYPSGIHAERDQREGLAAEARLPQFAARGVCVDQARNGECQDIIVQTGGGQRCAPVLLMQALWGGLGRMPPALHPCQLGQPGCGPCSCCRWQCHCGGCQVCHRQRGAWQVPHAEVAVPR